MIGTPLDILEGLWSLVLGWLPFLAGVIVGWTVALLACVTRKEKR